jgi:hypothetical protein
MRYDGILCITFGEEGEAFDAAVDQFAWDPVELPLELENHRSDCVHLLALACTQEFSDSLHICARQFTSDHLSADDRAP